MTALDVHVEYVKWHLSIAPFWTTQYKRDIDILGEFQWEAIEVNEGQEYVFSEERLWEMGLFILEKRKVRGDLIDIYEHWKEPCKKKLETGSFQ